MHKTVIRQLLRQWLVASALFWSAALGDAAPAPVQLPPPETEGGKPLMQALKARQTAREFSPKPLSRQWLSNLLWAGFGINRPPIAHRTAPSAMNSQEIDLYLATAEGVFLYDPKANALQPVLGEDIRLKTGGQDFVKTAPVAVLLVADLSRLAKAPPADRERYAWIDSGYISQNLYLYCASEGLATVVHELNRGPLKEALHLRPDQSVILAQAVGFPKEQAVRGTTR
jgi:nitroreductase